MSTSQSSPEPGFLACRSWNTQDIFQNIFFLLSLKYNQNHAASISQPDNDRIFLIYHLKALSHSIFSMCMESGHIVSNTHLNQDLSILHFPNCRFIRAKAGYTKRCCMSCFLIYKCKCWSFILSCWPGPVPGLRSEQQSYHCSSCVFVDRDWGRSRNLIIGLYRPALPTLITKH